MGFSIRTFNIHKGHLTKTWEQPGDGPNNFKVKPKLNKKLNIRFGKEALELADRVLMGRG